MQCTVQSEPIGNMLLTQPRPLHSSICTAVLSLSSTPHHPPTHPPACLPHSVHHLTHTRRNGGGREAITCKHTPAILLLFHHDTPKHIKSKSHIRVTQRGRASHAGCVLLSKPKQTAQMFVSVLHVSH